MRDSLSHAPHMPRPSICSPLPPHFSLLSKRRDSFPYFPIPSDASWTQADQLDSPWGEDHFASCAIGLRVTEHLHQRARYACAGSWQLQAPRCVDRRPEPAPHEPHKAGTQSLG
jgi:hypothetical protein